MGPGREGRPVDLGVVADVHRQGMEIQNRRDGMGDQPADRIGAIGRRQPDRRCRVLEDHDELLDPLWADPHSG